MTTAWYIPRSSDSDTSCPTCHTLIAVGIYHNSVGPSIRPGSSINSTNLYQKLFYNDKCVVILIEPEYL